ncbi:MAG: phage tail sheath family protein [Bacteroidia bacterium]
MATYKTPGVFIEEIPRLGSSIVGVPTAITGFVGYTEKATLVDGTNVTNKPVRITSLLEFQQIFGGAFHETFDVTLNGDVFGPNTISTIPTSIYDVGPPIVSTVTNYILFYQVRMFYANGGGACWIVSVGDYSSLTVDVDELNDGLALFEQIDEVTLLAVPESVFLDDTERKIIYDDMAIQCAKLQDRFAIVDAVHLAGNSIFDDATNFRDNDIGANNLKYVGAYYPALNTPIEYFYNDADITIIDNRPSGPYISPTDKLSDIKTTSINAVKATVTISPSGSSATPLGVNDGFKIIISVTPAIDATFTPGTDYSGGANLTQSVAALVDAINAHPVISLYVTAKVDAATPTQFFLTANLYGTIGNSYDANRAGSGTRFLVNAPLIGGAGSGADKALYNRIKAELAKYKLTLYPSATMAGVYAQVDNARGVWKAPANVGLTFVNQPSIQITDQDQENLNVDSVSGKSINAIRAFSGRGTLVWGARTLAGNDNEWRYINVRRLFIYVEESCKKATEFVVFESNTANTWQRVKGMIEAFLTNLWRDGGLAGATPKDAFFVRVGLGTTMTADDILNGKMIVEIGMAAARPAEFIILRFEHKLQES